MKLKNRFHQFVLLIAALPALCADAIARLRGEQIIHGANIAEGTHADSVTKLSAAAITTRHLLYKQGADVNHVAVAGATDIALGTVADEATAAEENIAVQLLGKGSSKRMVANAAIAAGVNVYAAASGKVAATGSNFVGVTLTASGADGDIIEVLDVVPTPSLAFTGGEAAVAADVLAIPVTARYVAKTTGGDAEALTLANGTPGQRLNIALVVDGGGAGTLTPTTVSGFATIVFADAGDIVDLEYVDDTVGWILVGSAGVAAPPVITI